MEDRAPPRTRGWTSVYLAVIVGHVGSPAHAGMDLLPPLPTAAESGLPRARGDGPAGRIKRVGSSWAPPRTRGWTRRRGASSSPTAGSPAHAGMDHKRK